MPRNLPALVQSAFEATSSTLCVIVDVERTDGQSFHYTNHNKSIVVGANTYKPSAGLTMTAVEMSLGMEVDNLQILGVLSQDEITQVDIEAGFYENALLTFMITSWADPSIGVAIMDRGHIGEIKHTDMDFQCEFLGLEHYYRQQIVELTSPVCRVKRFGDERCQLNAADWQHVEDVTGTWDPADPHQVTFTNVASVAAERYIVGFVRFNTGLNAGLERLIKHHSISGGNNVIILQDVFPFAIDTGDEARLEEGCDHLFATCSDIYDNALNYQGEPHLPGNVVMAKRGR